MDLKKKIKKRNEVINMWQGWILGILGIWVIIEPYLAMADSANKTVLVITGIVIAVLGFWSAYSERSM